MYGTKRIVIQIVESNIISSFAISYPYYVCVNYIRAAKKKQRLAIIDNIHPLYIIYVSHARYNFYNNLFHKIYKII